MNKLLRSGLISVFALISSAGLAYGVTADQWAQELADAINHVNKAKWDVQNPAQTIQHVGKVFQEEELGGFGWDSLDQQNFKTITEVMPAFIKKSLTTLRLTGEGQHKVDALHLLYTLGADMITMHEQGKRPCQDGKLLAYLIGFIGRLVVEQAGGSNPVLLREGNDLMAFAVDMINTCHVPGQKKSIKPTVAAEDFNFKNFEKIIEQAHAENVSGNVTPEESSDNGDEVSVSHQKFNPAQQLRKGRDTRNTKVFNPHGALTADDLAGM